MARKPPPTIDAPPMPPPTEREIALQREITQRLLEMGDRAKQRNLDNAVLLAQQAARGRGPLVDHFSELGRRFAETLDAPEKPERAKLRVIPR